ncbi:MAG: ATP-binding protein [Candidatus Acidiferrales bacterium]
MSIAPLEIDFLVRSEIDAIGPSVDKLIQRIKDAHGILEKESDIEIALFEALANAVIHGNREDASKQVHIRCRCQAGREVSIVVKDEGQGFDPSKVPDPRENIEAEHGRGILLMKTFMDDVHFEKGGTEVHMRKELRSITVIDRLKTFFEKCLSSLPPRKLKTLS